MNRTPYYGLLAEFPSAEHLVHAAQAAYREGYRLMDAHTPFHVKGVAEAMGFKRTWVPQLVFFGGIVGAGFGYMMQYLLHVYDYPINVGGRPLHSAPAFIPVAFECTILAAALTTVLGMLILNGLPRPYHPLFNVPRFTQASHDSFFLSVEARDKNFDLERTRQFLGSLGAKEVFEVEH